jgi:hypothetical protein
MEAVVAKVFVSSTFNDLREYRVAAFDVLRRLGHELIAMETLEAVAEDAASVAFKQIDAADLFIVIVGRKYGQTREDTGVSMVETEFEHAANASKPILVFLLDDSAPWPPELSESEPRLRRFKDRLTRARIVSFFSSLPDFTSKLEIALRGWDAARRQSTSEVTLDDLPLAWRLVVGSFAGPEFLRRLDPTAFVTAIEQWEEANNANKDAPWPSRLERARRALDNAQTDHEASALWLAWMRATRPMKADTDRTPPDENVT